MGESLCAYWAERCVYVRVCVCVCVGWVDGWVGKIRLG